MCFTYHSGDVVSNGADCGKPVMRVFANVPGLAGDARHVVNLFGGDYRNKLFVIRRRAVSD
jgi:hypothetical protein